MRISLFTQVLLTIGSTRVGILKIEHLLNITQASNMANSNTYPQIPATVWWGVRSLLNRKPNTTITDSMLAATLSVQPGAARQYVFELRKANIIDDDGKATEVAKEWRLDDKYSVAVDNLLSEIYPQELLDIAPPDNADRQTVINWFLGQGLGQGAATNKAATYLLISSGEPSESPERGKRKPTKKAQTRASKPKEDRPDKGQTEEGGISGSAGGQNMPAQGPIPLNLNLQIHISAEATSQQIEKVFSSMRKYLYDN